MGKEVNDHIVVGTGLEEGGGSGAAPGLSRSEAFLTVARRMGQA